MLDLFSFTVKILLGTLVGRQRCVVVSLELSREEMFGGRLAQIGTFDGTEMGNAALVQLFTTSVSFQESFLDIFELHHWGILDLIYLNAVVVFAQLEQSILGIEIDTLTIFLFIRVS